jgi:hypothetical protein
MEDPRLRPKQRLRFRGTRLAVRWQLIRPHPRWLSLREYLKLAEVPREGQKVTGMSTHVRVNKN